MNKPSHIKSKCPLLKKEFKRRKPKKKTMMTTWNGTHSSSSEKEVEQASNLCFMVDYDKEEICDSKSVLDFSNHK